MIWIITAVLAAVAFIGTGSTALLILALVNYEKFQQVFAQLLKMASWAVRSAHKQYVKQDLEGRVNEFAKGLKGDAPYLAETRVQIDLVDESIDRKSFLEEGKVILRLRRNDPDHMNFVYGAYLFVSTSLLSKAKRYISRSQGEAIDLYVTTQLFQQEKAHVVGTFLDEFLHPRVGADPKTKVATYYDCLSKLDAGGYFYPVLLQELDFLGNKVFGQRKDSRIISEVDGLMEFLETIAMRNVGDEEEMNFVRDYCKFAIAIVGKRFKVAAAGAEPYLGYLEGTVVPADTESIYLRGPADNEDVIDVICSRLADRYETVATRRYPAKLHIDGEEVEREQYLAVLRKRGLGVYQPSSRDDGVAS